MKYYSNSVKNSRTFYFFIISQHNLASRTALQGGRSRVRFPTVSLEFFNDIIFTAALWPWGRLSL